MDRVSATNSDTVSSRQLAVRGRSAAIFLQSVVLYAFANENGVRWIIQSEDFDTGTYIHVNETLRNIENHSTYCKHAGLCRTFLLLVVLFRKSQLCYLFLWRLGRRIRHQQTAAPWLIVFDLRPKTMDRAMDIDDWSVQCATAMFQ